MGRRKKTPRQACRDKCDKLWSLLIRRRDRGICQKCGKHTQTQASHVIPRTCMATRFHPLNGKALCGGCHMKWHSDPTGAHLWFVGKYGIERLAFLNGRRNSNYKYPLPDLELIHANLKRSWDDEIINFPSPYPAEMEVFE